MAVASSTSMASTTMVTGGASDRPARPRPPRATTLGAGDQVGQLVVDEVAGRVAVGGLAHRHQQGGPEELLAGTGRSTTKVVSPADGPAPTWMVSGQDDPGLLVADPWGRGTWRASSCRPVPGATSAAGWNWSTCWPLREQGGQQVGQLERVSTGRPSSAWTDWTRTGAWPRLRTSTR